MPHETSQELAAGEDDSREAAWLYRVLRSSKTWAVAGLLVVLSMTSDVENTVKYGGYDFRNRVVGARLLVAGLDPYTYIWKPGDPEVFLDPHAQPGLPFNRCTVPPTALGLYALTSGLHYKHQQVAWLCIQWSAVAGVIALLTAAAPAGIRRRFVLLTLLLLFVASETWRMHIERGQVYILLALLLATAYWIGRAGQRWASAPGVVSTRGQWASGFALGLAASLRPTLVLTSIPFALSGRWRVLAGGLIGICLGVGASFTVADVGDWKSYATAMNAHGRYHLNLDGVDREAVEQSAKDRPTPTTIEGMTNLQKWTEFAVRSSGLVHYLRQLPTPHRKALMERSLIPLLLGFSWVLYRGGRIRSLETCLMIGVFLALAAEFFIAAPRAPYNNILWCLPVALLVIQEGPTALFRGWLAVPLWLGLALANGVLPVARGDVLNLGNYALLAYFGIVSVRLARGANLLGDVAPPPAAGEGAIPAPHTSLARQRHKAQGRKR